MSQLIANNTIAIVWPGLFDDLTNEAITDAELECTFYDLAGDPVAGAEDIPMPHVASIPGTYYGTLSGLDATFTPGVRYQYKVEDVNLYAGQIYDEQWVMVAPGR